MEEEEDADIYADVTGIETLNSFLCATLRRRGPVFYGKGCPNSGRHTIQQKHVYEPQTSVLGEEGRRRGGGSKRSSDVDFQLRRRWARHGCSMLACRSSLLWFYGAAQMVGGGGVI